MLRRHRAKSFSAAYFNFEGTNAVRPLEIGNLDNACRSLATKLASMVVGIDAPALESPLLA